MKINLVRYLSAALENGRRRIKSIVRGTSDADTAFEAMPFGDDAVPPENFRAVQVETSKKGRTVIIGYINKNQLEDLLAGEKRIYSLRDDGETISQFIYLQQDGTMQIGGEGDFMVRYNELESAFEQLKSDFNDLVQAYNTHQHLGVTPGSGSTPPTTSTGTPSNADITPAKIDQIKTIPN